MIEHNRWNSSYILCVHTSEWSINSHLVKPSALVLLCFQKKLHAHAFSIKASCTNTEKYENPRGWNLEIDIASKTRIY